VAGSPRALLNLQKSPYDLSESISIAKHYYPRPTPCTKHPAKFCVHNNQVPEQVTQGHDMRAMGDAAAAAFPAGEDSPAAAQGLATYPTYRRTQPGQRHGARYATTWLAMAKAVVGRFKAVARTFRCTYTLLEG
jgi:hypothetical protein